MVVIGDSNKNAANQNGGVHPEKMKMLKQELFPEVTFCNVSERSNSVVTINGEKETLKKRTRLISNESGDSIESSTSSDKKKPEIPDGGFGWVVVFASLMVSMIADGISFSFGLIYTELLAHFHESKAKTAWIGSLFLAVPLLVGPVMSNLVDKYGCRKMTIIGGLLSSFGFALSAFGTSVEMLYLSFGIVSGLGLGIGYVTAVVSIAFWFDKKRTFATSVGASGTGIGTFLYAPFTQWLIDYYGWRGATLILAGTMLNTCVFGALMRDPDWLIEENRLESRSQSVTTFSNSSVCLEEIKKLLETGITKEAVLDTLVTNYNTEANQQIGDPNANGLKKYRSELFLPTYLGSQELDCIYEVKSLSRRSLRQKVGAEAPSRENLLSMSSAGNPTVAAGGGANNDRDKKPYLASMETLSPSEKISNFSLHSRDSSTDEGYLTQKQAKDQERFASSRYSLNENIFAANPNNSMANIRNNFQHRHNSLDILNDDMVHGYSMSTRDESTALIEANVNKLNGTVIAIPENDIPAFNRNGITGLRRLSKTKKFNRSNLRRNVSIRNSNFLKDMRIHRNSIHYRGALLNTHRYRLRASSCPNIYRNSMTTIAKEVEDTWYESFVDVMKSAFDFSLFLDLKFSIFNLSTLLLFIWFIIPYFYIVEHMKSYNYTEEDSAHLISIIGIFNTIGMIVLGFIGDRPWLNVNICYAVCMVLCGISVALIPIFVESYISLVGLCMLFGLTFASSFSFTPSILVSLVDLDDFTCAYGLVLLVQGLGIIVGPPLAGFIYEVTLRWDDSFYASGFFIALSGFLAYLIEFFERREKRLKGSDSDS
ncbi:uncharacterized protein LOC129952493 [Eupeodes corollae]|uniref:uncharacterized protein LOC129952493 n=1 Tax=Eupeodes corollae TaxID=290404 RepID=UPI00248FC490|nr:uncharacterized protein LOC129952493 [Eupeodes corollae]XP_055921067.1 uncharacterized protein LOC129952493 [Eupeodes corollae]